jgi:hypothetical protein
MEHRWAAKVAELQQRFDEELRRRMEAEIALSEAQVKAYANAKLDAATKEEDETKRVAQLHADAAANTRGVAAAEAGAKAIAAQARLEASNAQLRHDRDTAAEELQQAMATACERDATHMRQLEASDAEIDKPCDQLWLERRRANFVALPAANAGGDPALLEGLRQKQLELLKQDILMKDTEISQLRDSLKGAAQQNQLGGDRIAALEADLQKSVSPRAADGEDLLTKATQRCIALKRR